MKRDNDEFIKNLQRIVNEPKEEWIRRLYEVYGPKPNIQKRYHLTIVSAVEHDSKDDLLADLPECYKEDK